MMAAQKAMRHGWIPTGAYWVGNMVYTALALTGSAEEYDANAFDRTREAHAILRARCQTLRDHWSRLKDNPFSRNAVSEMLEAELPKIGLYLMPN